MNKAEMIMKAEALLKLLAHSEEDDLNNTAMQTGWLEKDIMEILRYLNEKECVSYLKLIGGDKIDTINGLELTAHGAEVACEKAPLIGKHTPTQSVYVGGNVGNISQAFGEHITVTQTQQISVELLKELITKDHELDKEHKSKLFEILDRFNTLKDSGENVTELLSKVMTLSAKYAPYFFSLALKFLN